MATIVLTDALKNVATSTLSEIASHNTKIADFIKTVENDLIKIQLFVKDHMGILKILLDALKQLREDELDKALTVQSRVVDMELPHHN